jgi:zinc protease
MFLIAGLCGMLLSLPLFAGPQIQSWHTQNGAKVLFVAAPDLPMLDMRVVFDAGSARDGDNPGISVLTNALLTDGAGEWDADQIAERMASVGAELDVDALRDMAYVSIRTLTQPKPLATAIETLATVLSQPTFEVDDLERNRQAMMTGLRREQQNPGEVAKKSFLSKVFAGHPYAIHSGGTEESLPAITRELIQSHHRQYYVARNAVIAIVGAVDRAQAEQLAEQVTRDLPAGEHAVELPQVEALASEEREWISFPSSQSHILMGQPGMHRGDPDYFVLYVANHILGGSGLVSILSDELREKRGLCYSVYSYFSPMRRNGPYIMGIQTQNARVDEALRVMRDTVKQFIDQGPTEAQLTAAKQNITGGFPLDIASNSKIVGYLAMLGFYDLPLDYLDKFVSRIESVTREQITETLRRRVNPDRFITVVVGNGEKTQEGS